MIRPGKESFTKGLMWLLRSIEPEETAPAYYGRPTNSLHRAPPRNLLDRAITSGWTQLGGSGGPLVGGGAGELQQR